MPTWGADTSGGTQLTTVDDVTEEFFNTIDAKAVLETQVEVLVNNESGSVTNGLIVSVYLTLDATSEDWDDFAWISFTIVPAGIAEEKKSFKIPSCFKWRIGCLAAAATDDYTVDMNFRERTA